MPATIELSADALIVHVEGADKHWALRSRLEIPVAHVVSAQPATEEAQEWLHGERVGGTHIRGVISTPTLSLLLRGPVRIALRPVRHACSRRLLRAGRTLRHLRSQAPFALAM
jgi:hypothetical protein